MVWRIAVRTAPSVHIPLNGARFLSADLMDWESKQPLLHVQTGFVPGFLSRIYGAYRSHVMSC